MTSLAVILKEAGIYISGSDTSEQFITDVALNNAGVTIFNGFSPEHVNDAEIVIYTGAHGGLDNIEVRSAIERGIRTISYAQAVGELMNGTLLGRKLKGISVAGTHGKTTTTAMTATILSRNDLDPSYLIGTSEIPSLGKSGHFGRGEYFVVEADEYAAEPNSDKRPKFHWHKPAIAIITNIEHDHPDIYPTLESFISAFDEFIQSLPAEGVLIVNGDDLNIQKIVTHVKIKTITFGFNQANDVVLSEVKSTIKYTSFRIKVFGTDLGEVKLNVAGEHNCLNATAAIIASLEVGLSTEQIKKGISYFIGSKRRLEYVGESGKGAIFYDDYAHHPTEIKKTLRAMREMYPSRKIVCIFQPHTYSRTKALFSEFTSSFSDSDSVILMDIFPSAREKPDFSLSSGMLADKIKKLHSDVHFLPTLDDVVKYFDENPPSGGDIILTMGAGDVYKISEKLKVKS